MSDVFDFYVYDDRSIQFALAEPIMLEDKDVTQFRFRIPKSLNGFDMTSWEWWFIFVNPNGTKYTTLLELTDDEDEPDDYSVATYTVGYGFSGIVGTVRFSIEALNVSGEEIVNEWHTKTYSTAVIDTLQGLRAIIPEPDGQVSTGITEEVKQALLQIARKVAYIDEHGQTYYNALYDALYAITAVVITPNSISLTSIGATSQLSARTVPEGGTVAWSSSNPSVATVDQNGLVTSVAWGSATITATSGGKSSTCSVLVAEATLTEISAVYTPSGTVYESDSLDSLKSRLVVTAHWSNGTTSEVASADYTLSGTLQMGTSIITVSYGGMTDTFEVDVVGLTGVYAQYTQSGTVYDTDSLDSLKDDLYVYVSYSNMTTRDLTASEYTLSGTLTVGTSTITVSYAGLTDRFSVTVAHADNSIINWDFTQSLVDSKQGLTATLGGSATQDSSGLHINTASDHAVLGKFLAVNQSYEIDVADMDISAWTYGNGRLFIWYNSNGGGLVYHAGTATWSIYRAQWYDPETLIPNKDYFKNSTVKIKVTATSSQYAKLVTIYKDGTEIMSAQVNNDPVDSAQNVYLGSTGSAAYSMTITGFRVYSEV